jgi:hypothetical protein
VEKSLEMQIVENLSSPAEKKSQITTLDIIPYLSEDAQHFARREINYTVQQYVTAEDQAELQAQLDDCKRWGIAPYVDNMPFMTHLPERFETRPLPARPSIARWRRAVPCSFFSKVIELDPRYLGFKSKRSGFVPNSKLETVARVVQRLYDERLIFLGMSQVFCVPLATLIPDAETIECVDHDANPRVCVMFWTFVKPEVEGAQELRAERLNVFLKNVAFTDKEGEIGNSDWSGL